MDRHDYQHNICKEEERYFVGSLTINLRICVFRLLILGGGGILIFALGRMRCVEGTSTSYTCTFQPDTFDCIQRVLFLHTIVYSDEHVKLPSGLSVLQIGPRTIVVWHLQQTALF